MKTLWLLVPFVATGACGGSTGDDGGKNPDALIVEACAKVTTCSNMTPEACEAELHADRADEVEKGCAAEFDALVACVAAKHSSCDQQVQDICGQELHAVDLCPGPDPNECSMGVGGAGPGAPPYYQSCDISCPTWGVSCETQGSPTLVCTCTTGPKSGTTFTSTACKDVSVSVGSEHCSG